MRRARRRLAAHPWPVFWVNLFLGPFLVIVTADVGKWLNTLVFALTIGLWWVTAILGVRATARRCAPLP